MTTIISTFKERPRTRTGLWAFRLGVTALFTPFILGFSAAVVVPFVGKVFGESFGRVFGFSVGIAVIALGIAAFVTSIRAFRAGERSWMMWAGFVPAMLVALFWVFMIIGEALVPH